MSQHHRPCVADFELIPCNGDEPLVNPATGRDFYCGKGPDTEICTPGSYCHWTLSFAKCCPLHQGGKCDLPHALLVIEGLFFRQQSS